MVPEGHLKWEGKNEGLGAVLQWGPGAMTLMSGLGGFAPRI